MTNADAGAEQEHGQTPFPPGSPSPIRQKQKQCPRAGISLLYYETLIQRQQAIQKRSLHW